MHTSGPEKTDYQGEGNTLKTGAKEPFPVAGIHTCSAHRGWAYGVTYNPYTKVANMAKRTMKPKRMMMTITSSSRSLMWYHLECNAGILSAFMVFYPVFAPNGLRNIRCGRSRVQMRHTVPVARIDSAATNGFFCSQPTRRMIRSHYRNTHLHILNGGMIQPPHEHGLGRSF